MIAAESYLSCSTEIWESWVRFNVCTRWPHVVCWPSVGPCHSVGCPPLSIVQTKINQITEIQPAEITSFQTALSVCQTVSMMGELLQQIYYHHGKNIRPEDCAIYWCNAVWFLGNVFRSSSLKTLTDIACSHLGPLKCKVALFIFHFIILILNYFLLLLLQWQNFFHKSK